MPVLGALLSLFLTIGPIVLVVLLVRRGSTGGIDGRGVRRAFQYGLLLVLVVVVAVGVVDLLALAFGAPDPARGDLARMLTFTVVGLPLLAAVAWWNRRTSRDDPTEHAQAGWAAYVTLAALVAVALTVTAGQTLLAAAWEQRFDPAALAGAVVWAAVWSGHLLLERRTVPSRHRVVHELLGAVLGLVLVCVGLIGTAAVLGSRMVGRSQSFGTALASSDAGELAALAVAGSVVWGVYWLTRLRRRPGSVAWTAYVLPLGVGAATVTVLTGASVALYHLAVWATGEAGPLAVHFSATPGAVAAVVVGGVVWLYHRSVLVAGTGHRAGPEQAVAGEQPIALVHGRRTEMARVHQYLLAGIGLGAGAVGVVRLVDAAAGLVGGADGGVVRGVLGALTLIAVGLPVWLVHWRGAQQSVVRDPVPEVEAPTRRVYLVLLFGLSAVLAVGALLAGAYQVLDAVLGAGLTLATVRDLGVPVGLLGVAVVISGYHGLVLRRDRAVLRARSAPRAARLRDVVLVGPPDRSLVEAVHRATGARVVAWPALRPEGSPAPGGPAAQVGAAGEIGLPREGTGPSEEVWTAQHVLDAVGGHVEPRVVVLALDSHLEAVGVAG